MNPRPLFEPGSDYSCKLLESLTTAIVVLDEDLRLAFVNAAAEVLLASSRRQILGLPFINLLVHHSDIIDGLRASLRDRRSYTEREVTLVAGSGQAITVDFTVTVIGEAAQPAELLVEMRQIDQRLRITREAHLIAQYNTARALARGFAHEVKNPLGGIRGAAQLLEQMLPETDLREYTGIVIREADRLRKLVDSMLGPRTLPERSAVNIHEVLEHVGALLTAEAGPRLILTRDYDPSIPTLSADHDQLAQAFLNVIRNASQAVDGSGKIILRSRVRRQCSIGTRRNRLVASIEVIDDGPGISEELQERIFMPMISTRSSGTGLGLSIAQNLINQHEGLIECSSRPGKTVFTILLPLEGDHERS